MKERYGKGACIVVVDVISSGEVALARLEQEPAVNFAGRRRAMEGVILV